VRRAILLFNPAAGNGSPFGQLPVVEAVAIALRSRGLQVEAIATHGPGTAGAQAAAIATDSNVDILFACGGDGTIHDVLQGLVTESGHAPMPALGIIPLGSANALARDLGLPLDPIAAALRQLDYLPRSVPVGKLEFLTAKGPATRYFTVMAGAGPHAALVYPLRAATPLISKRSLGRTAYYLRSLGLFLTECLPTRRRFPTFLVECGNPASGTSCQIEAVSAIAVRVASLGGLFHPLATGGTLDSPSLRLIVVRPPAQLGLALWFGLSWLGLSHRNPFAETFDVASFRCIPRALPPHLQADGEWLGKGELRISLVPDALRLLMPPR
jgi:diacylglycerol kinase family enzyme